MSDARHRRRLLLTRLGLALDRHPDKHSGSETSHLLFFRVTEARSALVAALKAAAPSDMKTRRMDVEYAARRDEEEEDVCQETGSQTPD